LNDEDVVATWIENPYWQYFSGMKRFEHEFPINPSSMTRWRKRIGEAGAEEPLKETIKAGLKLKVSSSFSSSESISTRQSRKKRFDFQQMPGCMIEPGSGWLILQKSAGLISCKITTASQNRCFTGKVVILMPVR